MAQAFGNMVPALASITLLSSHLIFGHWALSSPNSSLMSLVLMLASKHKVQRSHMHSFHLNHKFIQIRWLIHTQSLHVSLCYFKTTLKTRSFGCCCELHSSLRLRHATLTFCTLLVLYHYDTKNFSTGLLPGKQWEWEVQ